MKYDDKKATADYYDSDKVKMHPTGEFPVSFCSSSLLSFYSVPTHNILRASVFWPLIMPLFGVEDDEADQNRVPFAKLFSRSFSADQTLQREQMRGLVSAHLLTS